VSAPAPGRGAAAADRERWRPRRRPRVPVRLLWPVLGGAHPSLRGAGRRASGLRM